MAELPKNILERKKILDEIKYPGSVVIKKSASTGSESATNGSAAPINDPVVNVQRKKEEAAQSKAASVPSQSEIRADAAKKNLERYLKSDKRKEFQKKQQQNLQAQALLTGITDGQWTPEVDETEKKIRNEIDYWETEAKKERDSERISQQMAEIDAMDEQEKAAFDKYASKGTYTTAEEIDAYQNLKNKYGDRLDELVEARERTENQARAEQAAAYGAEKASTNGGAFLHSLLSVPANVVGGLTGTAARINDVFNGTGQYETLAQNTLGDVPMAYANAVRSTTQQRIEGEDPTLVRKALGTIYQGGMSALETAARMMAGGPLAAATLAGTGIFASTMQSAAAQGASQEQALALATINSGIEAATEKLPLDELFKVAKGGAKPAGQIVKNVLKQMGIEILEEEASLIGTTLAEAAILQEKSGYNQQIMKAAAMGVPYEQAKAEADRALLAEAINTALVSGVAGLFGAAGAEYAGARYVGDTSQQEAVEAPQTVQAEAQAQTQENAEQTVKEAQEQPQEAQEAPTQAQPEQRSTADVLTETITGKSEKPAQTSTQQVDTQEQSAEGGQIKGTGAAERGFTPKQAAINEYGNIPEGENPVRPDQLPVSTDGTDRVSYTARTAMEARVTPDEFVPLIENETMRGGFSFIPIHNDDTTRAATNSISREGWRTARANWTNHVRSGVTSPEITATGALLYNHAVNAGDTQEAMEILMDYQMAVRNTARSLQAARILKTLTPSDRLWMIRRSVDAMVQDMHLDHPITIDDTLAQRYQNAGTQEEADEILDQIAEEVARQIPATGMERFTALRYLNMLGNFKTQDRNVLGNIGSKLVYGLKDKIGAAIETIASEVTNGRVERTKAFATDRNTRRAAAQDYEEVRDWIMGNGRYNDQMSESDDFARRVQDRRRILPRGLEEARRVTEWAMNTGDEIFTRDAYARSLAGYLNARGIRTDNLETVDPDLLDRAREYAVRQAQEQTFRDNNQVSDFVSGMLRGRNTPTWARVIGEGVMPFRRTPANVLVRAEEFSPLGIINSAVNTVRSANGQISGEQLVDSWAKTLTGTALTVLGWSLYNMGVLSGGPDEDEEAEAYDQMNGNQNYAIRLNVDGETYTYTIDWATPAAMPMFLGAQLKKAFDNVEDLNWADLEKVFTSIGDPLIQMSMLQGVNDTLDSIKYSDNSMGQFLINSIASYVTQGLGNTLLGQMEKSTEGERMVTYVDKDSAVPEWMQKQVGKLSQKIPGWDYQQTEYINAKGETEEQPTDALGWLYNLTSPGYLKKVEVDDVSKELYRIHEVTKENVFPESPSTTLTWTDKTGTVHEDYHMTPEQAETLKKEAGQTYMRIAEAIMKSKDYNAMSEGQAAKALQQAEEYARKRAEIAAIGDNHTGYDEPWMEKMTEGREADYIIRRVTNSDLTNAMEALTIAWEKGYDTTSRSNKLEWAYKTFEEMSLAGKNDVKEWVTGTAADYIEAREAGISHEKFLDVAKLLDGIAPEAGKKEARAVQKAETIAKKPGLSEKDKELLIKQQVSDAQDKNIDELKELAKTNPEVKELGVDMELYAKLYRDHEDYTSGTGKKKRTYKYWAKELGISEKAAKALYEVF